MPSVNFIFVLKDKVSGKLQDINKNLDTTNSRLKATTVQLERLSKKTESIRKVGKAMTIGVTLPVLAMGGAMVKAAADIEAMQQQLSTMLGSAEAGGKMFEEIKTMAAKTPFETKDLMAATNTMLGFGIAQEKVLPLMNQLGDISGGNAERFQSLALAFSQVSSAGKLQGQDLLQMINAGFNPLESIAKKTGKTVGYWKEQMAKGKVTIEMVEQAMKDATSAGGRFYQMMDKQSKTALGQWSTFQDNLNMVLAEFGKLILPTAIKALQSLSETLEWLNSLSPGMKKFVLVLMGISAAIGPLLLVIGTLPVALKAIKEGVVLLTDAIKFLGKALLGLLKNPWAIGITVAIIAIIAIVKNWGKIVEWVKGVWQGFTNWLGSAIQKMGQWLDGLIEKLGWVAYLIPGLGQMKIGKDLTGAIAQKMSESKSGGGASNVDNSQHNSNNSSVVNNIKNFFAGSNPKMAKLTT